MLLDRGTGRVGYLINYIKSYNKKRVRLRGIYQSYTGSKWVREIRSIWPVSEKFYINGIHVEMIKMYVTCRNY